MALSSLLETASVQEVDCWLNVCEKMRTGCEKDVTTIAEAVDLKMKRFFFYAKCCSRETWQKDLVCKAEACMEKVLADCLRNRDLCMYRMILINQDMTQDLLLHRISNYVMTESVRVWVSGSYEEAKRTRCEEFVLFVRLSSSFFFPFQIRIVPSSKRRTGKLSLWFLSCFYGRERAGDFPRVFCLLYSFI